MAVTCGKRGYASKRAAKQAVREIQTLVGGGSAVRFYRCEKCGLWHWTKRRTR